MGVGDGGTDCEKQTDGHFIKHCQGVELTSIRTFILGWRVTTVGQNDQSVQGVLGFVFVSSKSLCCQRALTEPCLD